MYRIAGIAAAAMLLGSSAFALTETFNLEGNQSTNYASLPSSFSLTQGGLTATFDGKAFNGNTLVDGRIGRFGSGAGVVNSSTDNSHTVDSSGWKDFIQITFSQIVDVTKIKFGFFGDSDDFRLIKDSNGNGYIDAMDTRSAQIDIPNNGSFSGAVLASFIGTTDIFGVGAFDHNDSWKLKSVKVDYEPPAVPLPAAGLMLLAGLGVLGAAKRRKAA